jgi:hypothetical protein
VVFFLGQFAKIGLTAFLLVALHKWLGPLQWLPLLLGLIVALKAPLFALLYVRSLTGQEDEKPAGDGSAVDSPDSDAGGGRRPGLEGMDSGSIGTSSVGTSSVGISGVGSSSLGSSSIRKSSIQTSIREIATSDNSR